MVRHAGLEPQTYSQAGSQAGLVLLLTRVRLALDSAFLAYSSLLLTTAVIPSTYGGRAFEPLRYVLWAHTVLA